MRASSLLFQRPPSSTRRTVATRGHGRFSSSRPKFGRLGQEIETDFDQACPLPGGLLDLDLDHLVSGSGDHHADLRTAIRH